MSFIVASRYHSIVHVYKEGTPAVIIGWSEKYEELASAFEKKYIIYAKHLDNTITAFKGMIENFENEKKQIIKRLENI